jgi:hypothetical protein
VLLFPRLDVADLERIVGVALQLLDDRNHGKRPDGVGRRQLIECRIFGRPVARWIELRAELVGLERVLRRLEAVLVVSVDLARLHIALDVRGGLGGAKVEEVKPDQTGIFGVMVWVRSTYLAPFKLCS